MKLEINHRKRSEEKPTTRRLNNMLLKNQWVNEEIKKEIKKYLKTNDNEDTSTPNLWDAAKAVLSRKIHSNTGHPQKRRKNLKSTSHHLKELKKKNKQNLKSAEGRKTERSERKPIKKNKTKSRFYERVNKIDKPLTRRTTKKREPKKTK